MTVTPAIVDRRILLLRHAKSSWGDPGLDDQQRPLAPRGRKAAKQMARYLLREHIDPELVLCSSAVRARQTLARLAPALREDVTVRIEPKLYGAGTEALLARLRRLPTRITSVLVIGHNPGLQDLALSLAGTGEDLPRLQDKLPTGALAMLAIGPVAWRDLAPGAAELLALVSPRDLA